MVSQFASRARYVKVTSVDVMKSKKNCLPESAICSEPEDETPKGLAKHRLNQILSEVPRRGMFDLRLVLDSVYFFS